MSGTQIDFPFQWDNPGIYAKCRITAWVPRNDDDPIEITGVQVEELGSLGNSFAVEVSDEQMEALGEQMMALLHDRKLNGLRDNVRVFRDQNDGLYSLVIDAACETYESRDRR